MSDPSQVPWTGLGTMLGVVVVALRAEMRSRAQAAASKAEHQATQNAVAESKQEHRITQEAVKKVETLVNGPLGESLKATAAALLHVAHLTGSDGDILAALAAQKRADEHSAQSTMIAQFRLARDARQKEEAKL